MADYETIEVKRDGRVAILRFARPDVMNAMNGQLFREWVQATDELNADPEVGAIVVTGAGRAFSSGADVSDFRRASEGDEQVKRDWAEYQPIAFSGERLTASKPLIGAINGLALGAGLTCTFWFDVNIASSAARFSMRFAALGLTPELDSAWLLPRIVGLQQAKEMMLTARIYGADEARDLGLVRRVVEPEALEPEAVALAAEIAAHPVSTLATIKRMVFDDLLATDFDAIDERSEQSFAEARRSPEHREALRALGQKRDPRFHDAAHMAEVVERMRSRSSSGGS
jgi:enoyl-CoA hydratase/carnithine racemase